MATTADWARGKIGERHSVAAGSPAPSVTSWRLPDQLIAFF